MVRGCEMAKQYFPRVERGKLFRLKCSAEPGLASIGGAPTMQRGALDDFPPCTG